MADTYRYAECGLDNVFIQGMEPCVDEGEAVLHIPNVRGLHRAIAAVIVEHEAGISGKELRFLRTEMGMTQAELAKLVHRDAQSVGRWERGEHPLDSAAEALVRLHAIRRLGLDVRVQAVDEISARCIPTAGTQRIVIDGHDPQAYHALAA